MTFWDRSRTEEANLKSKNSQSRKDDLSWEDAIFTEKLSEDFTHQVMLALEGVEIEETDGVKDVEGRRAIPEGTSIAAQVGRCLSAKHTRKQKSWLAAAAVLALVSGTLLYTQPTLADMLRSLFAQGSYVDDGMKQAKDAGFVTISGEGATDQGYTLKVNEVIADSTRVVFGIDATDAKGNPVILGNLTQYAEFKIFDKQSGVFGDVPFTVSSGGNDTTERINLSFMRPVLTDKMQVDVKISEFSIVTGDAKDPSYKRVKGFWDFGFDVDLTKSKTQTLATPLQQSYVTPHGVRIEMEGATRTPSGGSLEFATQLTPEAAQRAINGQGGFHELEFHFEDEQGRWIEEKPDQNLEFGNHAQPDRWSGVTRWFYQLDNFNYDKKPYRFVLDGYTMKEKSADTIVLDPAHISEENPVRYNDGYDNILLRGFKFESDPNRQGKMIGSIPVTAAFSNFHFESDRWVAIDENGKEYPMSFLGGVIGDNRTKHVKLDADGRIEIEGLKKVPKKLTLKRTVVNRMYRDANWSFVLPQTGTQGVIPESK